MIAAHDLNKHGLTVASVVALRSNAPSALGQQMRFFPDHIKAAIDTLIASTLRDKFVQSSK